LALALFRFRRDMQRRGTRSYFPVYYCPSGIRISFLKPHTETVNAAYNNSPAPNASPHFDSRQLNLGSKWSFPEGIVSAGGTLTGWTYLALAHTITSFTAWLLFVFALASFILSIFATVKQSRWWLAIVFLAFVLLLCLAATTEGCVTDPCPL
jgi:hypothetical protein